MREREKERDRDKDRDTDTECERERKRERERERERDLMSSYVIGYKRHRKLGINKRTRVEEYMEEKEGKMGR